MRDKFELSELTDKQKQKLINFYNVKSIDDLNVLEDGNIVVKTEGSGRPEGLRRSERSESRVSGKQTKLYLQDHDGKNHELSIDDFISKQKNPPIGYGKVDKKDAKALLEDFISKIKPSDDKLHQLYVQANDDPQLLLFQQMVVFYSDKLKKVLCGNQINTKFIGASGHPGYSDLDIYNILKSPDGIVIKGFAFCTMPSKGEMFIDVICGTGGTSEIIKNLLKELPKLKCSYISLDSIETPQAIKFYSHLGFKKSDADTTKTIDAIKKTKAKTFEEFCKKSPSKAGGMLYLGKLPKKIKANYIYQADQWFDIIKKGEEPKLIAGGIGDFFKGIMNKGKELIGRFKPNLTDFTNQSKATLGKYGNWKITKMFIQRTPIMGILDKFLNGITFGKFQALKNKYGYDNLFHLQLGVYCTKGRATVKVVLEKNETVDITESKMWDPKGSFEFLDVDMMGKQFDLNTLVNTARTQQGDKKFFEYDAFTNNCQWFISYLLHGQGLYSPRAKAFLFQDLKEFTRELPGWLPGFARRVTDLGATVSNLRGKGSLRIPSVAPFPDKSGLEGGVGARKYITATEREAKRNAAIRASTYAPTIEARKEEEERMKGIQEYNETVSKKPKKKTIKDYQAEERYYKDLRAKEEAEKKAKEEAESKARQEAKEEADRLEAERKREVEKKKEEFQERKRQRAADVKAYKEGRIDDIKDNELRSRAQHERNLSQYYDFLDEDYKTKIAQEKENAMTNLLPSLMQLGIDKIPKIGKFANELIDATGAKDDTAEDKARRAYIEAGPPIRPDVLEGYTEELPEPDFEGNGKPADKKLYDEVKKDIVKKNPKHSLFRSAAIVKEYKKRGGEYSDDNKESGLKEWFSDKWISVNDYYHDDKMVPCGSSDTKKKFEEYPLCRPSKIVKQMSDSQIKKMLKAKTGPKPIQTAKILKTKKFNT